MKRIIIVLITIFFANMTKAQDTKLSINASISVPHYGIKSLNHEMGGNYSLIWHGQGAGAGFMGGIGFEYNTAFNYKILDTALTRNLHVAEAIIGIAIPNGWNEYISGPAAFVRIGLGMKTDGESYPNTPIKIALALQQNINFGDGVALDNLQFGIFLRGTLGTFIYKDLELDPVKNLHNNYFGTVEGGLRVYIVDSGSKNKSRRR